MNFWAIVSLSSSGFVRPNVLTRVMQRLYHVRTITVESRVS